MMEDGYVQELFKLFRESQYVQPPKKPFNAYERFVGNYEQACKDRNLNPNSEQAKNQWENLEKELKDEYFRLSKKDDELYEQLIRQYHSISNLIKKKKADGSVLFFQEKGVDKGLTNLQQLWDELSVEEKQIYSKKALQHCEDTIKESIEEYIINYEHYLNQQNEKPKDLQFVKQLEDDQDEIDQIDIIIGIKRTNGEKEYLVRFKGKTGKDAKWIPKKKLKKVKDIVKEFEDAYFKQSFQVNESSSGFDSTPQEQILQQNQNADKQINNIEQQQKDKIEYIEQEKQQLKKVKINIENKVQTKLQMNQSINNQIKEQKVQNQQETNSSLKNKQIKVKTPNKQEIVNKSNQTRKNKNLNDNNNKIKDNIIQEKLNKKQLGKLKILEKSQQNNQKQKSKQLDKSSTSNKDIQKKKDNLQIDQQIQSKRSRRLSNQDNKQEKSRSKNVKKQVNKKSNDKSKLQTPQKKSIIKQVEQQNESSSSKQISLKNKQLPVTKRQGRSRDSINSVVQQVSSAKLNSKQGVKDNKLAKKQQKVMVQQQSLSNSNRREKSVTKPKQQRKVKSKQRQSSEQSNVKSKTRSVSMQSIKSINNEIQYRKQTPVLKIRSRSVEPRTNLTRNSINKNNSSKSLRKVSPISKQSNQQLKKVQQKLQTNKKQSQIVQQQTYASNKKMINNQTTQQQKIDTRIGTRNSKMKNPIEINKKIAKNKMKKQNAKISKKKQKTEKSRQKKRVKNQKPVVKVNVTQTRQLRSKNTKGIGKRKH